MKELDSVVLLQDVPGCDLRAGDTGTVVLVHTPKAVEVEFHGADGVPHALLAIETGMLRKMRRGDVLCVRTAAHPRKRYPIGMEPKKLESKTSTRCHGEKITKRRHT
jgi:hypothetical protein